MISKLEETLTEMDKSLDVSSKLFREMIGMEGEPTKAKIKDAYEKITDTYRYGQAFFNQKDNPLTVEKEAWQLLEKRMEGYLANAETFLKGYPIFFKLNEQKKDELRNFISEGRTVTSYASTIVRSCACLYREFLEQEMGEGNVTDLAKYKEVRHRYRNITPEEIEQRRKEVGELIEKLQKPHKNGNGQAYTASSVDVKKK